MQNPDDELTRLFNNEIEKLNNKMIEKFGEPPKIRGVYPDIKRIFDVWIFYKNNYPEIKDFTDHLNMNLAMFVGKAQQHIKDQAYVIYNIDHEHFFEYLLNYVENNKIPELSKNDEKKMEERIAELKLKKMHSEMEQMFERDPSNREDFREYMMSENKKRSNGKNHCVICGDTEDKIKLIIISNLDYDNKHLCADCFNNQKRQGSKFSKIKNGESYMMN